MSFTNSNSFIRVAVVLCLMFSTTTLAEELDDHLDNLPQGRMSGLQFRGYQAQQRLRPRSLEVRLTKNGTRFVRDYTYPRLGEAWRDPSGMVWGDIVTNDDGTPRKMNQKNAAEYCKSIGAELPSGWYWSENEKHGNRDSDYGRLATYMGSTRVLNPAYSPYIQGSATQTVLPNLIYRDESRLEPIRSFYFWSSSVNRYHGRPYYYFFSGLSGGFGAGNGGYAEEYLVRCVIQSPSGALDEVSTSTGTPFVRDRRFPHLATDIWRDPSGMGWTDAATNDAGIVREMSHSDAVAYCTELNTRLHRDGKNQDLEVRLPSYSDFVRLREYMGAKSGEANGYTSQILPNLTYEAHGATRGRTFWSSSSPPTSWLTNPDTPAAYAFDGLSGTISFSSTERYFSRINNRHVDPGSRSVRCVIALR